MLRFSFNFEKITNNILSGFRFNLKRKEKTLDRDTFLISKGRNEKKKRNSFMRNGVAKNPL